MSSWDEIKSEERPMLFHLVNTTQYPKDAKIKYSLCGKRFENSPAYKGQECTCDECIKVFETVEQVKYNKNSLLVDQ